MPATFTRYPIDVERNDTGMGGKPPVDRRPTGGGGGGDDSGKHGSPSQRSRRLHLPQYRLTLLYALGGDLLLFAVLVGTYLIHAEIGQPSFAPGWQKLAIPPIEWINTVVLLLSSVTMELARRPFFSETEIMEEWLGLGRPTLRRSVPWLAATLALGGLFLTGQWMAWQQLAAEGIWPGSTPESHFFYLITHIHALHLLIGMVALLAAVGSMFFLKRVMWRQVAMDCTAWYWHMISALWLALFAFLLYAP